jgi:hypothetical protein
MGKWRAVILLLILLGSMMAVVPASAGRMNGPYPLDIDRYCGGTGMSYLAKGAIEGPHYAYKNFQCIGAQHPLTNGDMQKIARMEYWRGCKAVVLNPDSAYGWGVYCPERR